MKLSQLSDLARQERANRGKYAEGKTREFLKVVQLGCTEFDFERQYDARASRGRIPSQTGDFAFYMPGRHGVIEVKEVAHDFRLPKKNFDPAKWGRLKMRRLAGGEIIILICHTTTKLWRSPPFDYFIQHATLPSWDLSGFDTFGKVSEALRQYRIGLPA